MQIAEKETHELIQDYGTNTDVVEDKHEPIQGRQGQGHYFMDVHQHHSLHKAASTSFLSLYNEWYTFYLTVQLVISKELSY